MGAEIPRAFGASATETWYMVHTKPQRERKLSLGLATAGILHFLPMTQVVRTYLINGVNRPRKVDRLVWPGYLFACGGEETWWAIYESLCSITIRKTTVLGSLRESLEAYEKNYANGEITRDTKLAVGCPVEIVDGAMRHEKGIVDRVDGDRVFVSLLILGDLRSVEIEHAEWVEPI